MITEVEECGAMFLSAKKRHPLVMQHTNSGYVKRVRLQQHAAVAPLLLWPLQRTRTTGAFPQGRRSPVSLSLSLFLSLRTRLARMWGTPRNFASPAALLSWAGDIRPSIINVATHWPVCPPSVHPIQRGAVLRSTVCPCTREHERRSCQGADSREGCVGC